MCIYDPRCAHGRVHACVGEGQVCTFGGENETYLRGVEERGRGQRVPPSTIRRPGVAFIHFTRVCYPRTSTIPMHPLGPASGVPIYRLRQKIYDRTPSTRPFSPFLPSILPASIVTTFFPNEDVANWKRAASSSFDDDHSDRVANGGRWWRNGEERWKHRNRESKLDSIVVGRLGRNNVEKRIDEIPPEDRRK